MGSCLVPAKKAVFLEKAHYASKLKFKSLFLHSQSIFMRLQIFLGASWFAGSPEPAFQHRSRSPGAAQRAGSTFSSALFSPLVKVLLAKLEARVR